MRARDHRLFFILIFAIGLGMTVRTLFSDGRGSVKGHAPEPALPLDRGSESSATRSGAQATRDSAVRSSVDAKSPAPTRPEAQAMVAELEEILASKNDNDPRLDSDFQGLTPAMKTALREKYTQLPAEDRNGRGTIVFLLGRELASPDDVHFMKDVLNEPPCRSLSDCHHSPAPGEINEHAAMAGGVTLVYPQLVAIHSLETAMRSDHRDRLGPSLLDALRAAEKSESARVATAAREALAKK